MVPPGPVAAETPFVLWRDQWVLEGSTYSLSQVEHVATLPTAQEAGATLFTISLKAVPVGGSLHLFRDGVRPVYDDPNHLTGGHFKMQAPTMEIAQRAWRRLAGLFVAGHLPEGKHVTGVTFMRAHQTRGLKVWLSVTYQHVRSALRDGLRTILKGEIGNIKFSPHRYIVSKAPEPSDPALHDAGLTSDNSPNLSLQYGLLALPSDPPGLPLRPLATGAAGADPPAPQRPDGAWGLEAILSPSRSNPLSPSETSLFHIPDTAWGLLEYEILLIPSVLTKDPFSTPFPGVSTGPLCNPRTSLA